MRISAEDFRQRYASLSDEALLEVNRDERVEMARVCYDAELAQRGLKAKTAGSAASADPAAPEGEPMAAVAEFRSFNEAGLALSALRSADIPARVENPYQPYSEVSTLRVMVPESLLDVAREILATPLTDEELAAQAEALPPPDDSEEEPPAD